MKKNILKLSELNIDTQKRAILRWLVKPKTTDQLAAEMDCSINWASQTLRVWVAKGWVVKFRTDFGRVLYKLNPKVIEV